jgi:glyoxylase-like metal-dependent hydrolase (beta-lactamase superfamily II)
VGRCDLAGGNEEKLEKSLKKFHDLPGHLAILPGHGPECILEEELQHNPYVSHAH